MKMTLSPKKNGNFMTDSRRKRHCLRFDRWLSLSAAMIIMGCSGLTYTYAVYSGHIKMKFHYTQEQIDNIGAAKDFGAVVALASGFFLQLLPAMGHCVHWGTSEDIWLWSDVDDNCR